MRAKPEEQRRWKKTNQPNLTSEPQVPVRTLVSKNKVYSSWGVWPLNTCTLVHTHTCNTQPCMHTSTGTCMGLQASKCWCEQILLFPCQPTVQVYSLPVYIYIITQTLFKQPAKLAVIGLNVTISNSGKQVREAESSHLSILSERSFCLLFISSFFLFFLS